MNKNISVIEINGNRYDAVTGQLIGAVKRVADQVKKRTTEPIIDSVRHQASKSKELGKHIHQTARTAASAKSLKRQVKHSAQHVHQKTQRSHTLMRNAVTKPDVSKPLPGNTASRATNHVMTRLSRAKSVSQHAEVARFGHLAKNTHRLVVGEVLPRRHTKPTQPANTKAVALAHAAPGTVTNASHQQLERLLDHALAKADAHKQARHRPTGFWSHLKGPRWLTVSVSLFIMLLVGGFLAWHNIPQFSMKIAMLRAHITGSVPGYTPSGFSLKGPIRYADGTVRLDFKANADNTRAFTIQQEASNWDSTSLAANAVPANAQVQTSQVNGKKVYIYSHGDKKSATWVNDGTRTTIEDKANLNADQILKIAEGL